MPTHYEDYEKKYRFVKFERRNGIVQITIHRNNGHAYWSAFIGGLHDELGDAFYQVGRDPEARVVILTGAGDEFLTKMDTEGPSEGLGPVFFDRIYKEGKDLLMNLLEIEVPVIGAVNGNAWIHAELLTLSDLVVASEKASFADKVHFSSGVVPGDGVHVWWQMLLGPNRGREFLLTGQEIGAKEAKQLGFVAEVTPHDKVLSRAWELAEGLLKHNQLMLRYTRVCFVQHIKRRMQDDLGYGLMLENTASLHRFMLAQQAKK
jgi:enoyl-CoA hydratase/carnithine racemase